MQNEGNGESERLGRTYKGERQRMKEGASQIGREEKR